MLDLDFASPNRIANCSVTDVNMTNSFWDETASPINTVVVVIPDADAFVCVVKV